MSERWIKESEQMLKMMKELTSKKERDRLEVINSLRFSLTAIGRSVVGWRTWISNLSLMTRFSLEELKGIDDTLHKQAETIMQYDIEATKRVMDKFPRIKMPRRRTKEREQGIYV